MCLHFSMQGNNEGIEIKKLKQGNALQTQPYWTAKQNIKSHMCNHLLYCILQTSTYHIIIHTKILPSITILAIVIWELVVQPIKFNGHINDAIWLFCAAHYIFVNIIGPQPCISIFKGKIECISSTINIWPIILQAQQ